MWEDYWAHRYFEDPKAGEQEIEDDSFDLDDVLAELDKNGGSWETLTEAKYDRNQDPR